MDTITIPVHTARPYDILLGSSLLPHTGELVRQVHDGVRALIVTDSNVGPLYAKTVQDSLLAAGYQTVSVLTFPAGEKSKQLATITHMYAALADNRFDRHDLIVALGGGVTGDMAGFAAATWMRGIPFVQIPTSLLAQVDSSIGGKTGVDIPQGKNLIGAFWQPLRVIASVDTLSTLPEDFVIDGMGEVIKSACIRSEALFAQLEQDAPFSEALLTDIVRQCMEIKRAVVEADERESGERKLLNFGHTLGHAIEKQENFEGISHGRAVACGMAAVTKLSEQKGLTASGTAARLYALLQKFRLPTTPAAPLTTYVDGMLSDKKCSGGQLEFVLLSRIGDAFCYPVNTADLTAFLQG